MSSLVTTEAVDHLWYGDGWASRVPRRWGKRPAVLIAHEGLGLDHYQKSRAGWLAELCHIAFAFDYHRGGKPRRSSSSPSSTGTLAAFFSPGDSSWSRHKRDHSICRSSRMGQAVPMLDRARQALFETQLGLDPIVERLEP